MTVKKERLTKYKRFANGKNTKKIIFLKILRTCEYLSFTNNKISYMTNYLFLKTYKMYYRSLKNLF